MEAKAPEESTQFVSDTGPMIVVPLWVFERVSPRAFQIYCALTQAGWHDDIRELTDLCRCTIGEAEAALDELDDVAAIHISEDGRPVPYYLHPDGPQ